MTDIPCGAGIVQRVIARMLGSESGRTAERGSRVGESMAISVSGQILQAARIALLPLGREADVVTEAKGGGVIHTGNVRNGTAPVGVDVRTRIVVRNIRIREEELVCLGLPT